MLGRSPNDVLPTPAHQLKLLRRRKRYRRYKKQDRKKLSRDDMLEYLRSNEVRSSRMLMEVRKPDDPNVDDYRKEFGNWSDALHLAFGSIEASKHDAEYMLKAVLEFNLWSVKRFREARKVDPDIIPSWSSIRREWGSYSNLIESARRLDLRNLLLEYLKLMRRLGRTPTLNDLKKYNLRMDAAIKFYGGKKEMDEFVLMMKGKHEREIRG